jgi:metallo-beta-lactamase family protein
MEFPFIGGADGVTGSASLLTDTRLGLRALVDCGAYAERELERPDGAPRLGFDARLLSCVFLTHAEQARGSGLALCIADGGLKF